MWAVLTLGLSVLAVIFFYGDAPRPLIDRMKPVFGLRRHFSVHNLSACDVAFPQEMRRLAAAANHTLKLTPPSRAV